MTAATRRPALEQRSIDHIPEDERHGRPWSLLTLWFASNIQVNAIVTGALGIFVGLDLLWTIVTIVVGNLVGALFMAYHSVQGPRLGVPQMIQSRAQFGFAGAALPILVTIGIYLGFAVEGGVLAGDALAGWTGMSQTLGIVIFNVVLGLVALVGHDLIHQAGRVISVISLIVFAVLFVNLVGHVGAVHTASHDTWQNILLAISIFVAWQVTWAPYVSDYSRYLPADTSTAAAFWPTYAGAVIGGVWAMLIGAFAALLAPNAVDADTVGYLAGRLSGVHGLIVLALLLGLVPAQAEGPYGAFLAAVAAVSERGRIAGTVLQRAVFVTVFTVVAIVLAVVAGSHLLTTFENITLFLLYLLVPWTAINLTDFYLVRRGHYDIAALFQRDGAYGWISWPSVILYLVTIGIEIPFVDATLYEGPIAKALGGTDIAWIVGLLIASVVYWLLARARQIPDAPPQPGVDPLRD